MFSTRMSARKALPGEKQAAIFQALAENDFIDGFQEARPQFGMNAIAAIHGLLGNGFQTF